MLYLDTERSRVAQEREPKPEPITGHRVHSQRLMEHAQEELKKSDRLQASEKAWDAVAHALKVVADDLGMTYAHHSDARRVARRLAQGSPDEDILRGGFAIADGLHRNFYEDIQTREDLEDALAQVERFLAALAREHQRRKAA